MSILVQCTVCLKRYQVGDDRAGARVKCKACGAVLTIPSPGDANIAATAPAPSPAPAPAPARPAMRPVVQLPPPIAPRAVPPPLPPRTPEQFQVAGQDMFAGAAAPTPYAGTYLPLAAPPAKSKKGLIIGIVAGLFVLLAGLGIVGALIGHLLPPATFMTNATLQKRLVGTWAITHASNPATTGTVTFNANGSYRARIKTGAKLADFTGAFIVQSHRISLNVARINFGNHGVVGKVIGLGTIKEVTDTKLVLRTQYGDELYSRSGP